MNGLAPLKKLLTRVLAQVLIFLKFTIEDPKRITLIEADIPEQQLKITDVSLGKGTNDFKFFVISKEDLDSLKREYGK